MMKYVVELIGTFFLVLTIGNTAGDMAPLAIGAVLMVMVFAGGHVSGAHFNPAVTLAVFLRGKCSVTDVLPYMAAQVIGAAAAAAIVLYLKALTGIPPATPIAADNILRVIVAEFLYTFALCYVVLNVATAKGTSGNSFYGLAIGFTVLAGAYSVGGISGGVFNPAVGVGLIVLGKIAATSIWVYLVANFAAGAAAAFVFKTINPTDK